MKTQAKVYSLFEGRHALPVNEGAIFSGFDFEAKKGVKTPLYDEMLNNGGKLIVTGLTPALTQFLSDYVAAHYYRRDDQYCQFDGFGGPSLALLHFDAQSGTYWEQNF